MVVPVFTDEYVESGLLSVSVMVVPLFTDEYVESGPLSIRKYSGRPKYNPFFKKDRIFAAAYFRTQA